MTGSVLGFYTYDLVSGEPVPASSMDEAMSFCEEHKVIKQTQLACCWISTVFLGLDYSVNGETPLVFETMVFPSKDNLHDLACVRYSTRAEALEGHQRLVDKYETDLEVLSKAHAKKNN